MKLGIFLLILGLLIAGIGVCCWQYNNPIIYCTTYLGPQQLTAIGMGCTVLGGGLAIGGIVRMIIKK